MSALPMSPQVFAILSALIEQRAGLHYRPEDRELLEDKVSARALDAGFDSLLDYYYFLRYDPAGTEALDALVDSLLVHETYFFREALPLTVLVDDVLVPAVRDGRRPRVWCAACSTGEEPLTLAMMLAERGVLSGVEIVASDLSPRALERARTGEHNLRSLRALPPGVEGRWMEIRDGRPHVRPELVEAVDWRRVNLVDPAAVAALGAFDAILCRNVLIYFNDDTARRVVDALTRALVPGGHLLVGTSESLMRFGTALSCEERRGAFFYTRADT
ncbi:protein-glutamate O-methyltransferase CheR [Pyxidicoccus fallax]|uniref:protein-glutamate O-methyltransferase n=1 Tax=Pyxidicoccus fallax TaxID=394095 RepID=A0A848LKQ7_9BACT|nr:protein-glutamate O-methyltransferase CheR [Pyxidicoccus fallax]NMO18299.1 protein-glutamate O-methyltransferase CheR [Pyxidicoccus fallax]NPC80742.1 protein-glutamate O-methyltransferase CheR [Pyxidicoccus fallax]